MQLKQIIRVLLVTLALLMVPLIAMQFTAEMQWTLSDFVFMGVLIGSIGLMFEFVSTKGTNLSYKAATALALGAALLLIWGNLAVGIIGNEDNTANLFYFGALLVGLVGAFIANLRPRGMMRAMGATAVAILLVPVIAIIVFKPPFEEGMVPVFMLSAFFAGLFALSALLYKRAATA
jgi:uncharacterized membrane protein